MKKAFTAPEMSIYRFLRERVLTTSGTAQAIGYKLEGGSSSLGSDYTKASISWLDLLK